MEEQEHTFQRALKHIDISKIHQVMVATNHKWFLQDREMDIPTEEEIRRTIYRLWDSVKYSTTPTTRASTGGLHVIRWTWENSVEIEILYSPENFSAII